MEQSVIWGVDVSIGFLGLVWSKDHSYVAMQEEVERSGKQSQGNFSMGFKLDVMGRPKALVEIIGKSACYKVRKMWMKSRTVVLVGFFWANLLLMVFPHKTLIKN